MQKKKFNRKAIFASVFGILLFLALMIYALKQDPNYNPSQLVGEEAPIISAPLSTGGSFNSDQYFQKNKWVILNFWSSFCYVCRGEAPEMEYFYQLTQQKNEKFPYFVSINIQDNTETIKDWQKNYGQSFPVVQDLKGLISIQYGVTGTPETFFIDPQAKVRYRVAGQINRNIILRFIEWLEKNPTANQTEVTKAFIALRSNS
ncbi:TlpA family protein disulfide reductase [Pigmentibacter ruber]